MNELIARFFDLPLRQRVVAMVGAVFLLFFLYFWFLYGPRSEEIASKETRIEELTKERDRKAGLARNLDHMRKLVADLNAALKQAVAQLPDTKEIPDLLSAISTLGRESGLEVVQFRQRPEQPIDFYAEVPVDVLVRGTYDQIATFFSRVGHLTRIVNVAGIVMKTPARIQNDKIVLDTACTATTFRFLDEAERERLAKEREKKGNK